MRGPQAGRHLDLQRIGLAERPVQQIAGLAEQGRNLEGAGIQRLPPR